MKKSITGTATFEYVTEGSISLRYDEAIAKWMQNFNDDDEIIYMNYEKIAKKIGKLINAEVDDYYDYPYFDTYYATYMTFYTASDVSDKKIEKALKNKSFTIKLKAEVYS